MISDFALESPRSCYNILNSHINNEEVESDIRHLKRNQAGGADNVSPEHLKFSGPVFRIIAYASKTIFLNFSRMVYVPVFKGKGKDPKISEAYLPLQSSQMSFKSPLLIA